MLSFSKVSAFSSCVTWTPVDEPCLVMYRLGSGGAFVAAAEVEAGTSSFVLLQLRPDRAYQVRIVTARLETIAESGEFSTRPRSDDRIQQMYESLRSSDGEIDATDLDGEAHDRFIDELGRIAKEGDVVHLPVSIQGSVRHARAKVALPGRAITARPGDHLLMPFTRRGDVSSVTLQSASGEEAYVQYCPEDDSVTVHGVRYEVGDRFAQFGQSVIVAQGSITLAFTDSLSAAYPNSTALAATSSTQGTVYFSKVAMTSATFTGQQTAGSVGKTVQSHYVYHPATDTTQEIARHIHSMSSNGQDGTFALGLSHASGSNTYVDPVIQCARDEVRMTSSDATTTVNASFTKSGLSFDNAAAAVYLGSNKEFRLKFTAGTGGTNYLTIDALVGNVYVTKSSFTNQ